MNDWRLVVSGVLLLLLPISGLWLRRLGRPLNSLLFTVHKLLAVAIVILAVLLLRDLLRGSAITPLLLAMLAIAALAALALFASGVLLSLKNGTAPWILHLHRLATVVFLALLPLTFFFLTRVGPE